MLIDEYTRESLAIRVARRLGSLGVIKTLAEVMLWRGSRRALENPANEKWLSPISIWELRVLVEKGRIELNGGFEEWIAQAFTKFSPQKAPLTTEVVLAMSKIQLPHRDPAGAFLAATRKSS